jgi:hypothetical protein
MVSAIARAFSYLMRYRSWLRHYATDQKAEGSIPNVAVFFF